MALLLPSVQTAQRTEQATTTSYHHKPGNKNQPKNATHKWHSLGVQVSDVETAQHYALIKNNLRLKGKPTPENDIWIAALALQHHLILVTRDAHFREVENLTIESW